MGLKNKKILITAGPTWIPIDKVRVISNIATGETGILLAQRLTKIGAKVTLVLGPISDNNIFALNSRIKLIRFKSFDELKNIIRRQLLSKKYDMVIHSAAVSDYKPLKIYARKIKSGIKNWRLNLAPTEKLIDLIKRIDHRLFLVGFKFEPSTRKNFLIERAKSLLRHSDLDLVVANTINNKQYRAHIVNQNKTYGYFRNKRDLTRDLIRVIEKKFSLL